MSAAHRRIVQSASLVLAAALLVLALRGVDFARVARDLRAAQWWWLVPMAAATLLAHGLRAWRWTLLLNVLPPRGPEPGGGLQTGRADGNQGADLEGSSLDDGGAPRVGGAAQAAALRPVPIPSAFGALMVGYMANYAAPRLGELVRTANVSVRHHRPFAAVLGTVAAERALDMVTLALACASIPAVLAGRLGPMGDLLRSGMEGWLRAMASEWVILAVLAAVTVAFAAWGLRRLRGRAHRIARSFADGLRTIVHTRRPVVLGATTVCMWALYGIMAYLPMIMFGFDDAYGVTAWHAWAIMLIGALGFIAPSPGGIGSYHFITIQALVLMFAFDPSEAATYAIVTHAGQLVLYVVVGFVAMVTQGFSFADLVEQRA